MSKEQSPNFALGHKLAYGEKTWPQDYKTFYMLHSTKDDISPAHKSLNEEIKRHLSNS